MPVSLIYVAGEALLILATWCAFAILSNQPLFNPLQAIVALCFWWFGVGPIALGWFYQLVGEHEEALIAMESGAESLFIVSVGLIVYATIARLLLTLMQRWKLYTYAITPTGGTYDALLIYALWGTGLVSQALLGLASSMGVQGFSQENFLGVATRTDVWWMGVLRLGCQMGTIAMFACVWSLIMLGRKCPKALLWLAPVIAFQQVSIALVSGSKGSIVLLPFAVVVALLCRNQRLPWFLLTAVAVVFLAFVEPAVMEGRRFLGSSGAATSEDRIATYSAIMKNASSTTKTDWKQLEFEVLFRGVYPVAGEITRQNSLTSGQLQGNTLIQALAVVVPRVILPQKPDQDVGNFYSRTIGAEIGLTDPNDFINGIAMCAAFDVVHNYGWIAGVLTFGIIGVIWASLCGVWLTPQRLSSHPLSGYLSLTALAFEQPVAGFLSSLRDTVILLFLVAVSMAVYRLVGSRRKLAVER